MFTNVDNDLLTGMHLDRAGSESAAHLFKLYLFGGVTFVADFEPALIMAIDAHRGEHHTAFRGWPLITVRGIMLALIPGGREIGVEIALVDKVALNGAGGNMDSGIGVRADGAEVLEVFAYVDQLQLNATLSGTDLALIDEMTANGGHVNDGNKTIVFQHHGTIGHFHFNGNIVHLPHKRQTRSARRDLSFVNQITGNMGIVKIKAFIGSIDGGFGDD